MTSRLSWDRAGRGEPLVLLHGIGSTHDDFAALRPQLDAEYRVLAADLPGHGRSAPQSDMPDAILQLVHQATAAAAVDAPGPLRALRPSA